MNPLEELLIEEGLSISKDFLVNYLIPVLQKDGELALTAAIQAAGPIVSSLESTNLSPTEKFETAVKELAEAMEKEGKTLLDSTVQTAVQWVVTTFRAKAAALVK